MSQKSVLLTMLKENGAEGVSGHDLIYRHGITRAAAIVFDLKNEGWDIETFGGETLADGRKELASYRLKIPMKTLAPQMPAGLFEDLPALATPIDFDCGCQRGSDGRTWLRRCETHVNAPSVTSW